MTRTSKYGFSIKWSPHEKANRYVVYLDGNKHFSTEEECARLLDLQPNEQYEVEVSAEIDGEEFLYTDELIVETTKPKFDTASAESIADTELSEEELEQAFTDSHCYQDT